VRASSFFFSSNGRRKKAAAAAKMAARSSGAMPWPVIWKKPVLRQAAATSSTMAADAAEPGSRKKGAMSTVGR
jgi:hypothetical protein